MTQGELFIYTIALHRPQKINLIADRYGYPRPTDQESRLGFLQVFLEDEPEEALYELSLIHPDADLIVSAHREKQNRGISANVPIVESNNALGYMPSDSSINKAFSPKSIGTTGSILIALIVAVVAIIVIKKI